MNKPEQWALDKAEAIVLPWHGHSKSTQAIAQIAIIATALMEARAEENEKCALAVEAIIGSHRDWTPEEISELRTYDADAVSRATSKLIIKNAAQAIRERKDT